MNPFQISTDNLYKFMSLAGIALITLSVIFVYPKTISIEMEALKLKNEKEVISIQYEDLVYEQEQISLDIEDIDKRQRNDLKDLLELLDVEKSEILKLLKPKTLDISRKKVVAIAKTYKSKPEFKEKKRELLDEIAHLEERNADVLKRLDKLTKKREYLWEIKKQHFTKEQMLLGKGDELLLLKEQLRKQFLIVMLLVVSGVAVSIAGFFLWYTRIQKPADIEVRQKLANYRYHVKNRRKLFPHRQSGYE